MLLLFNKVKKRKKLLKIENYFIVIIYSYVISNTHEYRHLNKSPRVIRTYYIGVAYYTIILNSVNHIFIVLLILKYHPNTFKMVFG